MHPTGGWAGRVHTRVPDDGTVSCEPLLWAGSVCAPPSLLSDGLPVLFICSHCMQILQACLFYESSLCMCESEMGLSDLKRRKIFLWFMAPEGSSHGLWPHSWEAESIIVWWTP